MLALEIVTQKETAPQCLVCTGRGRSSHTQTLHHLYDRDVRVRQPCLANTWGLSPVSALAR